MKVVFSGIQPTGKIHLGNYLGSISKSLKLQNQIGKDYDKIFCCIVDHHSLTSKLTKQKIKTGIFEVTATLLACGIDPKRTIIFNQSLVKQHCELS